MQTIECVPEASRAFARDFLILQLWCWGQDARADLYGENLLLEHGFTRTRPPEAAPGRSHYKLLLPDGGGSVSLWGFGVFYGETDRGGVFLHRTKFRPKLFPESVSILDDETFSEWDLPRSTERVDTDADAERLAAIFGGLAHWIAEYEKWVIERRGYPYRREVVRGSAKHPATAELIAPVWSDLAAEIRDR